MTKKLISLFVAAMMVLSIIPAAALASEAERQSSPATEKALMTWNFESDPIADGWEFVDADGDGNNWSWYNNANFAHGGNCSIMSESYGSGAYDPDNWAISPEFTVPQAGASFTFFVKNYSNAYPENFGIYVITDAENEIAANQSVTGTEWVEMTYDISDFAGQTVKVAIRHFNSYNKWKFFIDDAKIINPPDPNAIAAADVSGFPARIIANQTVSELEQLLYIADDAEYTLDWTGVCTSNGTALGSDDALEAGETYVLVAQLTPPEGKYFAADAELTANEGEKEPDNAETYITDGGAHAYIAVSYECSKAAVTGFYFESDPAEEGWAYVDSDGDGRDWYWLAYGINQTVANMAFEGVGQLTSASYANAALTPDNWAISPEFEVAAFEGAVGMYIGAQDPGWSEEHFAVYVGTGEDIEGYTMISDELVSEPTYTYYEFDLSEYAGETVRIAVRHYNCTDMFRINLDSFELFGTDDEPIEEPTVIDTIEILDFTEPALGENPVFDVSVPEDAHYTVTFVTWYDTSKAVLDPDFVFVPGTYYATFDIEPEEGYAFCGDISEITVLINGSEELYSEVYSSVSEDGMLFHAETVDLVLDEPHETEAPSEPPVDDHKIVGYYFETDPEAEGWVFVDDDGDGNNWQWMDGVSYYAYEGYGSIASNSYLGGVALTPDNWAISPEIELLDANNSVTFYAMGRGGSYYGYEHFAVYVGSDIDNMAEVLPEQITTPSYVQYTVDLTGYENQTVCIAIRHFNCTDMSALNVDQFEVWGEQSDTPEEPIVIENIEINDFVVPEWGANPFYNVTVPSDAHYSINYTDWNWWDYDLDYGDIMNPTDLFDNAGYAYYQYFEIVPDEGYIFTDETMITVNGETTIIENCGFSAELGYFWAYTIDFTVEEPEPAIIGDVDLNGEVDIADALMALRYMMGLIELTDEQLAQAEVDGDGEVSMVDCLLIQRKAMGIIGSFPVEQP